MRGEMSVMVGPGRAAFLKEMFPPGTEITPGDTKLIWDSRNNDEVESARATFDRLIGKGFIAYKAEGKEGTKGERISRFDAAAERIILLPKMQGGC